MEGLKNKFLNNNNKLMKYMKLKTLNTLVMLYTISIIDLT